MKYFNFKKWQKKEKNENLSIEEINESIGVRINGIRNISKITTEQIRWIKAYIARYHILVIHGNQKLTEADQIAFTKKLGLLEGPPIYCTPQLQSHKGSKSEHTIKKTSVFWHSESSYKERPVYLSVLQMVEIPKNGAETYFASLLNLYNTLPKTLKNQWKNYKVSYQNNVRHPLFWKHPYNGKKAIYFDIGFVTKIKDDCEKEEELSQKRTNEIFDYINKKLDEDKSCFIHKWKKGDIIIIDNYAVAKRAHFSMEDEKRTVLSTATQGIYF